MTSLILKAKHWQIFLVVVAIPMVIQITKMIIALGNMTEETIKKQLPDPNLFGNLYLAPSAGTIIYMLALMVWFWAIVVGLEKHVPKESKVKMTRFKIFFFVPPVYAILLFFIFRYVINEMYGFNTMNDNEQFNQVASMLKIMALVIPLHFFAMFCILHTLYYVAKTYKTALLQRKVEFPDLIGDFFLMLIFPIGIWIMQPNINKIEKGIYENSQPVV